MYKTITYFVGLMVGVMVVTPSKADEIGTPFTSVASLDYCADQYVLALADPKQILAVTKGAVLKDSFYRNLAANHKTFSATAAEVLALSPTVVVETWTANPRLKALGKRVGVRVFTTEFAPLGKQGFDVLFKNIETIGEALGQGARAKTMVAKSKADLAWLEGQLKSPLTVAYMTPSGYTAGTGTVVDEIIKLAGFKTYAEEQGLTGWQPLPLESVVMARPDVILTSFFDTNLATRSAWSLSRHGPISDMLETLPRIDVPGKYFACSGLFAIAAAVQVRKLAADQGLFKSEADVKGESHE